MASLEELFAQKAALERQIVDAQRAERGAAISQVRALMLQHGLTLADLGNRGPQPTPRRTGGGKKVAAKYRDAATGQTWSGRGLQPKWLRAALAAGRSLADFAI